MAIHADCPYPAAHKLGVEERLTRLEDIARLLAREAAQGQGQMGEPFWKFIDAIREERHE